MVLKKKEVKSPSHMTIAAFSRTLGREAHVLTLQPDLLWQQLYNWLQKKAGEEILTPAIQFTKRNTPGASSRDRAGTPSREPEAVLRTLKGHKGAIWGCAFSPDGAWIVTSSYDNTLKMWAVVSGHRLRTLKGHNENVWACAVSPDGARIVSASNDQTLKIWDAHTGRQLQTLFGHSGGIWGCAFSPDGTWIVSASDDEELKVWDANSGLELRSLHGFPDGIWGCAVSSDGSRIVSANFDNSLRIWGAASGRLMRSLTGHTDQVKTCAFSPDGTRIVSGSMDQTLKVWDAISGRELRQLAGHTDYVSACSFSPDGRWIVSSGWDKMIKVWDADSGHEQCYIPFPGPITCVDLHPWKPVAACGDSSGDLYLQKLPGIDYGPIVVTAVEKKRKLEILCPACQKKFLIKQEQLGTVIPCPTRDCGLSLQVNPFVIRSAGVTAAQQDNEQRPGVSKESGAEQPGNQEPFLTRAIQHKGNLCVNCPVCHHYLPIHVELLGEIVNCPCQGCHASFRIDPVPIKMP